MSDDLCPCGSQSPATDCCAPYLSGDKKPPTAEALMRSRYTAFARGNVDYIMDTHDPETVEDVSRDEVKAWSEQSDWQGMEILATRAGGVDDIAGTVDFVAKYKLQGLSTEHRERAQFRKVDGGWLFVDGGAIPKEREQTAAKWVGGKKRKAKAKKRK